MCGIWFGKCDNNTNALKIQHRGPDSTIMNCIDDYTFVFHRLAINDISSSGNQPMTAGNTTFMCNGEIYNHEFLKSELQNSFKSKSDCEPILHMIENNVPMRDICNSLDGVFAFVAMKGSTILAARDPVGVRPLFFGINSDDASLAFCSEAKGLQDFCKIVLEFPKGHYYTSHDNLFHKYHAVERPSECVVPYSGSTLKFLLESAVEKRLMSERPVSFFLSGGLDSSLIAAIGAKYLKKIETFSIGIGDSPDLKAAKEVSTFINSKHTEVRFTTSEAKAVLTDVIYALETYDCTTIRASVPMYILSKHVSTKTGNKVILSGEGADELFGGYLYFHNAPTNQEFQDETLRLLDNVHAHDVLRADRCTASHGLELRVPFFDRALVQYVKSIHPKHKFSKNIEKNILRKAFENDNLLPDSILWRQKNGMSDAVGYTWVNFIKEYANEHISDTHYETNKNLYTTNPPLSKEELLYREIYTDLYPKLDVLPHVWRPKWTQETDPSATLLNIHKK